MWKLNNTNGVYVQRSYNEGKPVKMSRWFSKMHLMRNWPIQLEFTIFHAVPQNHRNLHFTLSYCHH